PRDRRRAARLRPDSALPLSLAGDDGPRRPRREGVSGVRGAADRLRDGPADIPGRAPRIHAALPEPRAAVRVARAASERRRLETGKGRSTVVTEFREGEGRYEMVL